MLWDLSVPSWNIEYRCIQSTAKINQMWSILLDCWMLLHSVWIRAPSTNTGPTDSTYIVIEPWYNYVQIIVAYGIKLLGEWVLNFNAANFPTRISGLQPQLLFSVIVLELFAILIICVIMVEKVPNMKRIKKIFAKNRSDCFYKIHKRLQNKYVDCSKPQSIDSNKHFCPEPEHSHGSTSACRDTHNRSR